MNKVFFSIILLALTAVSLIGCRSGGQVPQDTVIAVMTPTPVPIECKNEFYPLDAPQFGDNGVLKYVTKQENLKMIDIVDGSGDEEVIINDKVEVHYTGWLINGCIFDSTYPREAPAKFRIGKGQVIKGWDLGIPGMKIGGIRRLEIGSDLAYGMEGISGVIPENATLVFEVKLVDIIRLVTNE